MKLQVFVCWRGSAKRWERYKKKEEQQQLVVSLCC
jgi:hypothetical protein